MPVSNNPNTIANTNNNIDSNDLLNEDFDDDDDEEDLPLLPGYIPATRPDDIPSLWNQTLLGNFKERYVHRIISDSQMVSFKCFPP
jgi:hypothetical protein